MGPSVPIAGGSRGIGRAMSKSTKIMTGRYNTMNAPRTDRLPRTERQGRIDLAAAYRMAAANGWDDTIYTHLSASVPGEAGHYLINPFGLGFDEITASSLVKVNTAGQVVDGSGARVNPSGFAIHGAVHAARPDVECVVHLHTPWGVALSMLPQGLQPTSQWAMRLHGRLGRHAGIRWQRLRPQFRLAGHRAAVARPRREGGGHRRRHPRRPHRAGVRRRPGRDQRHRLGLRQLGPGARAGCR